MKAEGHQNIVGKYKISWKTVASFDLGWKFETESTLTEANNAKIILFVLDIQIKHDEVINSLFSSLTNITLVLYYKKNENIQNYAIF